jgi:hypothetical protein
MLTEIRQAYGRSWAFALALPGIVAIPIAAEAMQHAIEWRIGMFESFDLARGAENNSLRMGFGHVKIAALFIMGYWVTRFLAFGGDARRTLRFDGTAMGLFAMVLTFDALMAIVQTRAGGWLSQLVPSGWPLLLTGLAAMLAAMALQLFLTPWKAGAALGNPHLHLAASIRMMRGHIGWSFGYTLVMIVPVMVLHYALNGFAIGRAPALAIGLLSADSLLVGYMAVLLPASAFVIAERAARLRGESLLAAEEDALPRAGSLRPA